MGLVKKLDVGCGKFQSPKYIGLDKDDYGQKYVQDIRDGLPEGEWEEIRIKHCLEHLDNDSVIKFLNECWGKCKVLFVIVPSVYAPERAFHIDHRTFYSETTFKNLKRPMDKRIKSWKIESMNLTKKKDIYVKLKPYE